MLEYADAVWAAMCSDAALHMLEQVQERFCRRILRLPSNVAGAFVRAELGLPSLKERSTAAAFRFFGRLARMVAQKEDRLVAFIFQKRCSQVDDGRGEFSWCRAIKAKLVAYGWQDVWETREVPDGWADAVYKKCRAQSRTDASLRMAGMSSLAVARRLGCPNNLAWLDRARSHPGAAIRLKLRCGAAPLMERVGASARLPRDQRLCLMCDQKVVESAEHFTCQCPYFEEQRLQCLARISEMLGGEKAPAVRRAMQERDLRLFLGNHLWSELPAAVARGVDSVVCDYLKVAWRAAGEFGWPSVRRETNGV